MLLPAALTLASGPAAQFHRPDVVLVAAISPAGAGAGDPQPANAPPPEAGAQPGPLPLPQDAPPPSQTSDTSGDQLNEIVVIARHKPPPSDPIEHINIASFHAIEAVDKVLVAPLATGYTHAVPAPLRHGLHNFITNLHEPVVFLSFLLEGKAGKAAETLGRFAINTTVGIGGVFDVAKRKPINLPHRRNGFADLMGYYGIGPGPFLMLPLIGPTTVRDLIGTGLDLAALPSPPGPVFHSTAYKVVLFTGRSLDERVESDKRLRRIRASIDPYVTLRKTYLCQRRQEIAGLHNRPAPDCMPPAMTAPLAPHNNATPAGGTSSPSTGQSPQSAPGQVTAHPAD